MAALKKSSIIIISIIILLIVGIVITLLILQYKQNEQGSVKPSFDTVLPNGKTNDQVGDWTLVSPENNDPVYAYSDMIDGVGIIVSQQIVPESFGDDVIGKVEEMAKQFNATTKIQTDNGQTFYIGMSAKGPQWVILTKDNLLVLIKSDNKIPETGWKKYISSLR